MSFYVFVSAYTFSYSMRKNICTLYTCNTLSRCRLHVRYAWHVHHRYHEFSAVPARKTTNGEKTFFVPPLFQHLKANQRVHNIIFSKKLYFITVSDCRSRCLRFLLCKVLLVSLLIYFLRKSAGGNSLTFFPGTL